MAFPVRLIFLALFVCLQAFAAAADYYPTKAWRESTPEEQGLDSQVLAGMVDNIAQKHLNVHSVTVIRHGNVVLDAYFYPYRPTATHDVASVSKSITAAITGSAVDKGLIRVDQTMLSFFPQEAPADPDPQKQKITVANLLNMQSGLDCGFAPGEQELEQMRRTNTWVRFTLALPMKYEPGGKFGYCSPGYHVLSSIITAATHQPEADFGKKYLFEPLGIKDVVWPPDEEGRTHGWGDSHFYPRDFGKIGYLYLHDGMWDGRQIVSKEWVKKSITKQADPGRGAGGGYGYGWWLANTAGMEEFGGNGRGGQKVAVWPGKDMIVIVTGGGYPASEVGPAIARSIKADQPLPANAAASTELKAKVAEVAKAPAPTATPDLPAMAEKVSGSFYELPRNSSRLDGLSLTFKGNKEAQLKLKYLGTDLAMPVGLDGVYRLGPYGPLRLLAGATGKWTSDTDFLLDVNMISNINHYTIAIHFEDGQVQTTISESSGLIRNGKVTGKKI
ncbi:MAG TPA: serine hydrolase [Bryobacteraceae bacterium]|nr:serine hydrolase [Bryobacteraceae bacterium]